jgi:spore coat protein U-like protein
MIQTRSERSASMSAHERRPRIVRLAIALGLALAALDAAAVTCTASTPGLAFGGYDVFAAGATNGNGTLTIHCVLDLLDLGEQKVKYTISMSTGSSNSFVQRTMKSGTNALGYNLYTTNSYSTVWGDGTGSTATVPGSLVLNSGHPSQTDIATVYGRIPALQDAAVATDYRDNVTVTVTY